MKRVLHCMVRGQRLAAVQQADSPLGGRVFRIRLVRPPKPEVLHLEPGDILEWDEGAEWVRVERFQPTDSRRLVRGGRVWAI